LGRGQRGGVHGPCHVAHVDEVALGAESAQLELAVAGLHGASHGLGETAEGGAGGGARPGGREDPEHDGVQAGPEDEFGGGQLADAVRAAGARDGVLRGGGAGLAGAVLGAAPDLDEPGAAAAAGRGPGASGVREPGGLGPYTALRPIWTSRAPQPLRRRASQTGATATVLCRVSSRAPPRVAPAQLTTTPGWTASRNRVRAPGLPVA